MSMDTDIQKRLRQQCRLKNRHRSLMRDGLVALIAMTSAMLEESQYVQANLNPLHVYK
jgi:hypothetical protein